MPLSTASWLVKNTHLQDKQIAEFCQISLREVMDLRADRIQICPVDPINYTQQLTVKEIQWGTADKNRKLHMNGQLFDSLKPGDFKNKEKPYMPSKLRKSKKKAVLSLLKTYPMITEKEVGQLMSVPLKTIKEYKANLDQLILDNALEDDIEPYVNINPLWKTIKAKYNLEEL
jgi:hypothetical protein